jgi:LuxR family transcriptional regulator, maltose regulon positive regulatory protein
VTALLEEVPVVVRSRLRPPDPHPDELARPRLLSRLDAYDEPVVLLAAPSGSGKTVLLSQWVRSTGKRCAWVSLGPTRAGLCDVWSAILQALEPLCDDKRQITLRDRTDPQILLNRVIPGLLNKLSGAESLVLVLDGLDAVVDPRAKESLTHFVLQLPAHVHTVLSTNRPAGGPVALLRAGGRLAELSTADLRLTGSEAHKLLEVVAGRVVAEDEATRIYRGVDGWAVGLRLAGIALRHGRGGCLPREVADYVRAEVLDKAAPNERAAILQTSVLRELRASWVNAITGNWATQALASFARSSLFLQATADGWVCHAALRATAAQHLSQSEPDLRSTLHSRAVRLLGREGDLLGAADHALEAGQPRQACDMLAAAWPTARPGDLLERVRRLGAQLAGPAASSAAAAALAQGDAEWAVQLLAGSECDSHVVPALAFLQLGELTKARACLEASREAGQSQTWCTVVSQLVAGLSDLWDGRLDDAALLLEATATAAAAIDYCDVLVRALDGIVACALMQRDHDRARETAQRAVATYARDSQRATVPIISRAYLEVSGYEVPAMEDVAPSRSNGGGPHQAAFAEALRASAAQTAGQLVASRLAQSRGRSLLKLEQAGALLRTLLADQPRGPAESALDATNRLTNRELVVLRALSGPLTLREIARELHVSHNTIKTQVSSLFRKLDAHDRAAAVHAARERGVIPRA